MNARILHAAARGARLQTRSYLFPEWGTPDMICLTSQDQRVLEFRIHPDDAHLEYGPISTALREAAKTGTVPYTISGLMARCAAVYEMPYGFIEQKDAATFYLILAESFADLGL